MNWNEWHQEYRCPENHSGQSVSELASDLNVDVPARLMGLHRIMDVKMAA
ncbi:hypothetical protein [[Ruminococcus] lactaris]